MPKNDGQSFREEDFEDDEEVGDPAEFEDGDLLENDEGDDEEETDPSFIDDDVEEDDNGEYDDEADILDPVPRHG